MSDAGSVSGSEPDPISSFDRIRNSKFGHVVLDILFGILTPKEGTYKIISKTLFQTTPPSLSESPSGTIRFNAPVSRDTLNAHAAILSEDIRHLEPLRERIARYRDEVCTDVPGDEPYAIIFEEGGKMKGRHREQMGVVMEEIGKAKEVAAEQILCARERRKWRRGVWGFGGEEREKVVRRCEREGEREGGGE